MYKVPLSYNSIGPDEVVAAEKVLHSGFLTQGREVEAFERQMADRLGVAHAILVNSGSSANLVAIEAAVYLSQLRPDLSVTTVERGDEVVIQGLNWPSTLKPMLNHGLTPVFCDVDLDSLNASVEHIDAVVSSRTKMVVGVPVLGNPTHLDEVRAYCQERRLIFVEDSCESLGAVTPSGRPVGTLGLAAAFSFYFSHHMTTIEGGMVLTDSRHIADISYALRAHGWSRNLRLEDFLDVTASQVDPRFCFVLPGYNVRSTELNAAIGRVQLAKLDVGLANRRRIALGRAKSLDAYSDRVRVPGTDAGDGHSWMTFPLMFADSSLRDRARESLESDGIETRPIIVGNILRQPLARNLPLAPRQPDLPACDEVFRRGLMIGLDPNSDTVTEAHVIAALHGAVGD